MAQWIWGDTPQPLPNLGWVTSDESWLSLLPKNSTVVGNKGHGSSLWSQAAKITVRLEDDSTKSYFIKLTETPIGKKMSRSEFECSKLLHKFAPDLVPCPLGWGTYTMEPELHFFITDFVDLIDEDFPTPDVFCAKLAAMHKASQRDPVNPGRFGFDFNTCAGPIEQICTWNSSWENFFSAKLRDLFVKDEAVHGPCQDYDELKPILFDKVIPRLLRPLQSNGRTLVPTFVHGDLWHCNTASQAKPDCPPIIFDVASFWAHNEYDMYMMHSPRYVFNKHYVNEYRRHFPPSDPVEDVDDRLLLYTMVADIDSSISYPDSTRYRQWLIENMRKMALKYPDGYTEVDETPKHPVDLSSDVKHATADARKDSTTA